MDSERFEEIHFLPDTMNDPNDHYVLFADAYGTSIDSRVTGIGNSINTFFCICAILYSAYS